MIKALVFGGAFNPPTNAHIQLAEFAKNKTNSDVVIFVPSKMTYIKDEQKKDFAFSDKMRLEMLNEIAKNRDWMIVSDYEIKLDQQPRTYFTLKHLKEQGYSCKLLFGSDKLSELETGWKHVDAICKEFGIVCLERNHDNCNQIVLQSSFLSQYRSMIQIIETPNDFQMISSTLVRKYFMEQNYSEIESFVPTELNGLRNIERKEFDEK